MRSNMWRRMRTLVCAGILMVSGTNWNLASANAAGIEEVPALPALVAEEAPVLPALAVEEAPALEPLEGEEETEETNKETYAEGKIVVTRDELLAQYNSVKERAQDTCTNASWNIFVSAREYAKVILDKADASSDEISKAYYDLKTAFDGLENRGDYKVLNDTIDAYSSIKQSWYVDGGNHWENFQNALKNYDPDLPVSRQEEIDAYKNKMNQAYNELEQNLKWMSTDNTQYEVKMNDEIKGHYTYNKPFVVSTEDIVVPSGEEFKGWSRDGILLTKDPIYKFYTIGDYNVKPEFGLASEITPITKNAIITDVAVLNYQENQKKVRFSAQVTVPDNYILKSAGLEWGLNDSKTLSTPAYIDRCNKAYQFSVTMVGLPDDQTMHARIVATVEARTTGRTFTFYSDERKADPQNTARMK